MTSPPRLVFAHYFGGSARSWTALIRALGDTFECIAPDLPGFGGAPSPDGLSLSDYAETLSEAAGDARFIAIGHSMGGKIALGLATRRPPNLAAIVLLAASPPTPEPMTEDERRRNLAAFGDRDAARAQLIEIARGLSGQALDAAADDAMRVSEGAWRWWLERGSRDDISSETRGLTIPALEVAGDDDAVLGADTAPAIAAGLPGARLEIIAGGGHLLPLERPAAVAALIRDFAGRLTA